MHHNTTPDFDAANRAAIARGFSLFDLARTVQAYAHEYKISYAAAIEGIAEGHELPQEQIDALHTLLCRSN